jgi:hypothetical protein
MIILDELATRELARGHALHLSAADDRFATAIPIAGRRAARMHLAAANPKFQPRKSSAPELSSELTIEFNVEA